MVHEGWIVAAYVAGYAVGTGVSFWWRVVLAMEEKSKDRGDGDA